MVWVTQLLHPGPARGSASLSVALYHVPQCTVNPCLRRVCDEQCNVLPILATELRMKSTACIGLHRAALGCIRLHWAASGCTELHWAALGCSGLQRAAAGCSRLHQAAHLQRSAIPSLLDDPHPFIHGLTRTPHSPLAKPACLAAQRQHCFVLWHHK